MADGLPVGHDIQPAVAIPQQGREFLFNLSARDCLDSLAPTLTISISNVDHRPPAAIRQLEDRSFICSALPHSLKLLRALPTRSVIVYCQACALIENLGAC